MHKTASYLSKKFILKTNLKEASNIDLRLKRLSKKIME